MPKISQYPAQTGASVANGDLFPIVDVGSPNVSEYITADELAQMPQLTSRYAPLPGAWTSWTPSLTASTTNPTLGSGSSATGSYAKLGRLVVATANITFGTSSSAGSGTYRISMPVASVATTRVVGSGIITDTSGEDAWTCSLIYIPGATAVQLYVTALSNIGRVTDAIPFTFSDTDTIFVTMTYEAAS